MSKTSADREADRKLATVLAGARSTPMRVHEKLVRNYYSYTRMMKSFHSTMQFLPTVSDLVQDPELIVDMFLTVPCGVVVPIASGRGWVRKRTGELHDSYAMKHVAGLFTLSQDSRHQAMLWLDIYCSSVHSKLTRQVRNLVLPQLSRKYQLPQASRSYYWLSLLPLPWRWPGAVGMPGSGRRSPADLAMLVYNAQRMARMTTRYFEARYE
jgi:hypothetical protein